MLVWTEQFATGVALVDTQHKMLIEKINFLEKILGGPLPPKEKCDELVNFLLRGNSSYESNDDITSPLSPPRAKFIVAMHWVEHVSINSPRPQRHAGHTLRRQCFQCRPRWNEGAIGG